MRRHFRAGGQEIVVAYLEGVVVFLDFLFIFGLVGGDVGDFLAIGAPGELLDAVGSVGNLFRFTTGHGQDKKLELGIFGGSVYGFESEAIALGGPAREADAFAIVGERVRSTGGDVDEDEVAIRAILVEIDAGDDAGDGFAVRGDLRVRDGGDFGEVVELESTRLGGSGDGE